MEKSFISKILNAASIYYSAIVISRLIGVISTIFLLIYIDKDNFGIAAILLSIWIVTRSISFADNVNLVVGYKGNDPHYIDTVATQWLFMSIMHALILIILADPLLTIFPMIPSKFAIYILSLTCIFAGLVHPGFYKVQRDFKFGPIFFAEILSKIASVTVAIIVAVIFKNFYALIIGLFVEFFVRALYSSFSYGFKWKFSLKSLRQLRSYSIWYFFLSVISCLSLQVEIILLPLFVSTIELGAFYVSRRISRMMIADIAMAISEAIFAGMFKVSHDKELMNKLFLQSVQAYAIITLPVGFGISVISYDLIYLLFQEKWINAANIISIMAPIIAIHSLGSAIQAFVMANKKHYYFLWRELFIFIVKVILIISAGYLFGFNGIVIAVITSWLLQFMLSIYIFKRISKLKIILFFKAIKRPAISTLVMYVGLFFFENILTITAIEFALWFTVFAKIILGIAIYFSMLSFLWIMDEKPNDSIESMLIYFIKGLLKLKKSKIT